jgi:hypothetical protein
MSAEFFRSSAAKGGQAFHTPGEQRLKVLQSLGRGQMGEQMREIGMGLDAARLGRFGEREEAARRRSAGLAGREQESLSRNDKWLNCILANIVRQARFAMREKNLELRSLIDGVGERLAKLALGRGTFGAQSDAGVPKVATPCALRPCFDHHCGQLTGSIGWYMRLKPSHDAGRKIEGCGQFANAVPFFRISDQHGFYVIL